MALTMLEVAAGASDTAAYVRAASTITVMEIAG